MEGAASAGADTETVLLAERGVGYCRDCLTCYKDLESEIAPCSIDDDVQGILEAIRDADGVFFADSEVCYAMIRDGASNTALFSESIVGPGGPSVALEPGNEQDVVVMLRSPPLSESVCTVVGSSADTTRGARWVDGWPRYAGYDHYLAPNSDVPDCAIIAPMRGSGGKEDA